MTHFDLIRDALAFGLQQHRSGLLDDVRMATMVHFIEARLALIEAQQAGTVSLPVLTLRQLAERVAPPPGRSFDVIQGGKLS